MQFLLSMSLHFGVHDLIKQNGMLRRFRGKLCRVWCGLARMKFIGTVLVWQM